MDKKENHQNLLWNEKKVMKRNNKRITRKEELLLPSYRWRLDEKKTRATDIEIIKVTC